MEDNTFTIVLNHYFEKLKPFTPAERWIFICLLKFKNNKTHIAFPKLDTLCEISGFTKPFICRALKKLEKNGLIKRQRRYKDSTNYSFPGVTQRLSNPAVKHTSGQSEVTAESMDVNPAVTTLLLDTNTNEQTITDSIEPASYVYKKIPENYKESQDRLKADIYPSNAGGVIDFWFDIHWKSNPNKRPIVQDSKDAGQAKNLINYAKKQERPKGFIKALVKYFYQDSCPIWEWRNPPSKELSTIVQHYRKLVEWMDSRDPKKSKNQSQAEYWQKVKNGQLPDPKRS